MAQKTKKADTKETRTKVTRITATDTERSSKRVTKETKPASKKPAATTKKTTKKSTESRNIFVRIGGYFKGAWQELRQVRWPNRRTTWGLTFAVLVFTAFFLVLIVLLDTTFKFLFEQILR